MGTFLCRNKYVKKKIYVCIIKIFYDCIAIKMNICWIISVFTSMQSYGTCLLQETKHLHGPLKVLWALGTVPRSYRASQKKERSPGGAMAESEAYPPAPGLQSPSLFHSSFFPSKTADGIQSNRQQGLTSQLPPVAKQYQQGLCPEVERKIANIPKTFLASHFLLWKWENSLGANSENHE